MPRRRPCLHNGSDCARGRPLSRDDRTERLTGQAMPARDLENVVDDLVTFAAGGFAALIGERTPREGGSPG